MVFVKTTRTGIKSRMMNREGRRTKEGTTQNGEELGKRKSKLMCSVKGANLRVRYAQLSSFITKIRMRTIMGGRI